MSYRVPKDSHFQEKMKKKKENRAPVHDDFGKIISDAEIKRVIDKSIHEKKVNLALLFGSVGGFIGFIKAVGDIEKGGRFGVLKFAGGSIAGGVAGYYLASQDERIEREKAIEKIKQKRRLENEKEK